MCNRGGYQPKKSSIDHGNPPRNPSGVPMLTRVEPKFVECDKCIYWRKDTAHREKYTRQCRKHAPEPVINSSLMDTKQVAVWPTTKSHEGCFEGDEKGAASEEYVRIVRNDEGFSHIVKGKEVFRSVVPKHTNLSKLEDEAEATATTEEEEIPHDKDEEKRT